MTQYRITSAGDRRITTASDPRIWNRYVELVTADAASLDDTPTLEFFGTDPEAESITYEIQIGLNAVFGTGEVVGGYRENDPITGLTEFPLVVYDNDGQVFKVASDAVLGKARFLVKRDGSPTGNVYAEVYAASDGTYGSDARPPVGATPLAISDPIDVTTISTTAAWLDFVFSGADQIVLSAGTPYAIVMSFPAGVAGTTVTTYRDETVSVDPGNWTGFWVNWQGNVLYDTPYAVYAADTVELDKSSKTDAGFVDVTDGSDTDPFDSGDTVSFTVQAGDELAPDTYYWRVRGRPDYRGEVMQDSPILFWLLDDTGTPVNDETTNNRDGSVAASPLYSEPGLITDGGTSIKLNGTTQYIERADETAFDMLGTQAFTLEGWFKPSIMDATNRRLFAHYKTGAPAEGYNVYASDTELTFERQRNGVGQWATEARGLLVNQIYHIVARYDGANMTLWKNGVQVGGPSAVSTSLIDQSTPFRVGSLSDSVGSLFGGWVDGIAVYTTNLSDTRIKAHYHAGIEFWSSWSETRSFDVSSGTLYTQDLTGGLSFSGSVSKKTTKTLAGALGFSGATTKRANKALSGVVSFSGAIQKQAAKTLAGALSFSGALLASHLFNVVLAGGLSFAGALSRKTNKGLTGGVSFAGSLSKTANKALSGAVSFAGALTKRGTKAFAGSVSFAGALLKQAGKNLAASVSFSGAVTTVKSFTKALAGAVSFSGALVKTSNRSFGGVLSFSGALSRRAGKNLSGVLSFAGNLVKRTGKSFSGALSFSGNLLKTAGKALSGAVSFVGGLLKTPGKALSGAVSFTGALAPRANKALAATVSFVGGLTKRSNKTLGAVLSFSGNMVPSLQNKVKEFTAGLSFSGTLSKTVPRQFSGQVSFAGVLTRQANKYLTAVLSFSGLVNRTAQKYMTGTLSFAGALKRLGGKYLQSTLSFAGDLRKQTNKRLTATLSFIGSLNTFLVWIEIQAFVKAVFLTMAHWGGAVMNMFAVDRTEPIVYEDGVTAHHEPGTSQSVRVKGPQEVAYKRGTNVMFGTTFTDPKTGQMFDPDPGTIKLYCKFVNTGTYLTGYDRATGGKAMTKLAVGDYETDVQFQLNDTVGQYEVEMEGLVGAKRYLDSVKISVKA